MQVTREGLQLGSDLIRAGSMRISVCGLGKVGLTLLACLSAAGHKVIGFDILPEIVDKLNNRSLNTAESGVLNRICRSTKEQLWATLDAEEAIGNSDLTFIVVPTPSNRLGGFSLRHVLAACDDIGRGIMKKHAASAHTVALASTVLPGASEHLIIPRLEAASGRKVGERLGYCYNPSFIAQGEIVKGIETPDYILIGESHKEAGDLVLAAHRLMALESTPVARMQVIEGEITKLASNTHETMRVSFANMLAAACNEIPHANVDRVTEALAHRMGKRFFKGAVPYGGPCWPRDNGALAAFLDAVGVSSSMPKAIDLFNREHAKYIFYKTLELTEPGSTVGIIGLAYKTQTQLVDESFGIDLARWLAQEQRKVLTWDPLSLDEAKKCLGGAVAYAEEPEQCLKEAQLIMLLTPLPELLSIDWILAKDKTVVDCWRFLPSESIEKIGRYIAFGEGDGDGQDRKTWLKDKLGQKLELLCN